MPGILITVVKSLVTFTWMYALGEPYALLQVVARNSLQGISVQFAVPLPDGQVQYWAAVTLIEPASIASSSARAVIPATSPERAVFCEP